MSNRRESGYGVCYLDGRRSVADRFEPHPMIDSSAECTRSLEARWLAWVKSSFAIAVVGVLVVLGVANVTLYSRWHEVEDGVLWSSRAEGVTASEIVPGAAAALAGIQAGDVLVAVNGAPVATSADVVESQHRSAH